MNSKEFMMLENDYVCNYETLIGSKTLQLCSDEMDEKEF